MFYHINNRKSSNAWPPDMPVCLSLETQENKFVTAQGKLVLNPTHFGLSDQNSCQISSLNPEGKVADFKIDKKIKISQLYILKQLNTEPLHNV